MTDHTRNDPKLWRNHQRENLIRQQIVNLLLQYPPQRGYDEPAILSYAISSFCPTSADGLHLRGKEPVWVHRPW
jgi:hypothetical protein